MSLDLVLQTELGEEDRLRKFLEALGVKGTVSSPCAVRLKDIDKEKFENEWRHKAISMKIDASWVDPNLKLSNFHSVCNGYGLHFTPIGDIGRNCHSGRQR